MREPLRYGLKARMYRVWHLGHSTQCRMRSLMTCELAVLLKPPTNELILRAHVRVTIDSSGKPGWTFADMARSDWTFPDAVPSPQTRANGLAGERGPKTSTLGLGSGYHGLRPPWNWTCRYVRERGFRAMRVSTGNSSLVYWAAAFIAVPSVPRPRRKRRTSATFPLPPQPRKLDSGLACVAARNVLPELQRGWEHPTPCRGPCG